MDFNTVSSLAFIAMTLEIIRRGADLTKASAIQLDQRAVDCLQLNNVANGGEAQSDKTVSTTKKSSLYASSVSRVRSRRHDRRRSRHPTSAHDFRLKSLLEDHIIQDDGMPHPSARRKKLGSRRRQRRLTTKLFQNFSTSPSMEELVTSDVAAEEKTVPDVMTKNTIDSVETGFTSDDVRSDDVMKDWLWTTTFLKGNIEKLVLYAALGLTLGALCVLSACLLRLCLTTQSTSSRSARLHRDSNSSSPLSTGQTTPSRAGTASRKSPGSPVWSRDDGTGARLAKSAALWAQRNELSGNDWSARPEDRLLGSCQDPAQESPFYREPWAGGAVSRSLGRPYTNPYRHDSYRTDGVRTLNYRPLPTE